jgi:hypothetical protein
LELQALEVAKPAFDKYGASLLAIVRTSLPSRFCRMRKARWRRFSNRATHCGHLVQSFRDDTLSQTAKLLIMAVFELGSGHVDGTLLVGHHEGDEIAIDVAGRIGHAHVQAHLADGQVIVDYELELGSIAGRSGDVARPRLILRKDDGSGR